MTQKDSTKISAGVKGVLSQDQDLLRSLMQMMMQGTLDAEMDECLGAQRYERSDGRRDTFAPAAPRPLAGPSPRRTRYWRGQSSVRKGLAGRPSAL